jgi:hypothetical protein
MGTVGRLVPGRPEEISHRKFQPTARVRIDARTPGTTSGVRNASNKGSDVARMAPIRLPILFR